MSRQILVSTTSPLAVGMPLRGLVWLESFGTYILANLEWIVTLILYVVGAGLLALATHTTGQVSVATTTLLPQHDNWVANMMPVTVPKSPVKTAAAVQPACIEQQPASWQAPFSNCPSLNLDFSKLTNGAVNQKDFTIYTGAPEANHEAQYYTDDKQNLAIENGNLVLRALNQPSNGYSYTSARINTLHKHDFQYGKLSIRAQLPSSVGTWPAIWLLPSDNIYKNAVPAANANRDLNDGELDIAESVGIEPHTVYGVAHSLHETAHYFDTTNLPDNDNIYHDYGLEWTPTSLVFTIDNNPFFSLQKPANTSFADWPYDQHFYLILNLALGGDWGGRDKTDFPKDGVDTSALPASMHIASIEYYRYIAPDATVANKN